MVFDSVALDNVAAKYANDSTQGVENMNNARHKHPSGGLLLTRHESVQFMLDGLLSYPLCQKFNKTELAERAGVSRHSVANHIELLLTVEIIEEVEGTSPQRYRFNEESPVSQEIIDLNGRINAVGEAKTTGTNE